MVSSFLDDSLKFDMREETCGGGKSNKKWVFVSLKLCPIKVGIHFDTFGSTKKRICLLFKAAQLCSLLYSVFFCFFFAVPFPKVWKIAMYDECFEIFVSVMEFFRIVLNNLEYFGKFRIFWNIWNVLEYL